MGNISKDARETSRKDIHTKEKGNGIDGTDMDSTNGKWGTQKKNKKTWGMRIKKEMRYRRK